MPLPIANRCHSAIVVADSHSNKFATRCLFPSRQSLIANRCRYLSWLIATPTCLPFAHSLLAIRCRYPSWLFRANRRSPLLFATRHSLLTAV
ncbi:MAG: hypothetical protein RRB12_06545 [Armatimonadota bacterium]|nr:hypothetical protein [Armatimonadota bacterium]